ncbi:MAG: hypothetical protein M5U34_22190 [Chloroflexi bacterium]|nr:hypothetical protein [Chloroflexota bacterium]
MGELQAPTEAQEITGETAVSEDVRKRLKSLRTDTGANGLMLSTFSGELIFQVASSQHTNLLALSQALSQTIQSSFALAEHLNTDTPNTIQYHAGEKSGVVLRQYRPPLFSDDLLRCAVAPGADWHDLGVYTAGD